MKCTNRFNNQEFHILPHCICVFCVYLTTNSEVFSIQHKLICFYNRDEKCLQRGTDWVFK
jgi:Golgi nucleoside diphosphatase